MTSPTSSQNGELKRQSQFKLFDVLLLFAGVCLSLGLLTPASGGRPMDAAMAIGAVAVMTLSGLAISYPISRYLLPTRFTVFAVNHAGYLLVVCCVAAAENYRLLYEIPTLMAGPVTLFRSSSWSPFQLDPVSRSCVLGFATLLMLLLMSAHTFRRNLIGAALTCLGAALWYLAGVYGVLANGP